MKILVVGTGGSIVSGISTASDQMARTLVDYGIEVERLNAGVRMRRRSNALNLENVWAVVADALAVYRRARRGHADLVWIHTFGVPTLPALRALAMAGAARASGRPALVHFHAFGLERSLDEGGRTLRLVLRALMAVVSATVVLYGGAADALRRVSGRSEIHVLNNWVDVASELASPPQPPPLRLVFVGGLVRRKGVPLLLDAMRALDDVPVELRLVGGAGEDGPEALERLHEAAGDLVAAGRVTFAGEPDAVGVRTEIRAAHLLVLPSEAEGTPISMLEAMAEGRPVLVSDAGNMRSVVEDTESGWVLPDRRPETIAASVRRIAGDPAGLAAASEQAWRAAGDRYSAAARRPQIEAILASLPTR
ncbi:MAG TPA: glycosyltransferase family 4 protein [Cryptosporangiaceae bacterium]|nr:glycosyltransferase family 4 protein [Cryptosporangiaceae bacterium]